MAGLSREIARKTSYSNPNYDILYGLDSRIIREFDINAAGLSMIRRFNMLGKKDIQQLEAMDKYTRNVVIGKIRGQDVEFSKELKLHIRDTMQEFMEENGMVDEDIISINNDAVTVIQPRNKVNKLRVNDIQYKISGVYTSAMFISRVSFFRGKDETLTVKGISDTGRSMCGDYMLEEFNSWLGALENGERIIDVLKDVSSFKDLYCERKLDINYYRSIRNGNLQMNEMGSKYAIVSFMNEFVDAEWLDKIDIAPTLIEFIIPFINILISRYTPT